MNKRFNEYFKNAIFLYQDKVKKTFFLSNKK